MDTLILGLTIGATAGISPGPLLFLTITSALRSGARAGVIVACAPLISDIVVVTAVLLLLGQLPHAALGVIGVVGAGFLAWLGVQTWRQAATASLSLARAEGPAPTWVMLRRGVLVNFLSPHPWISWATALGPLTLAAGRGHPLHGAALVVGFYATLVGTKIGIALLVGRGRGRLSDPGYRTALRVAAGLLVAAGAGLFVEFGIPLLR